MKHFYCAITALCLSLAVQGSCAQEKNIGLGLIIGEPTGISAKVWTSNENAFDFGLGWSIGKDRIGNSNGNDNGVSRVRIHADYLWHSFDALHTSGRLPLYYGFGARFNSGSEGNSSEAIRTVLGITWMPQEMPIDVFLEVVPSLQLAPSRGFGFDAGIGARYFF